MSKRVRPASQLAAKNKKDEHNFGKATRRGKHLGKNKRNCNAVDKITRSPHKLVFSLFVLKGAASTSTRNLLKGKKKNLGRKQKIKGENNLVDGISELPDEILSSIVSLLPLKEAAATSILSKRWLYVWASTVTLNFDAQLEFGETLWRFNSMPPELKDLEQHRYVNWIDTVVEQHRGRVIEQFRASFYVDCCFASSIDKWIQFAMNKRVQVLELVFHIESYNRWGDLYAFPHKLLGLENGSTSKLEHMRSDIPSLRSCGYNTGFKLLRVLHFQFVDVTGEVLEYFLSNCPVLERLTVHAAFTNLVNLRVIGPSVALKYLDIKFCPDLQSIEICDANLVSLDYEGNAINMLVSNVPLLVEVSISVSLDFAVDGDDGEIYFKSVEVPFTQLSCCLSQLEVLKLDIEGAMYNRNHVFPILTNLKHLELLVKADDRWALCRLTSFMKASPFLQRLVLKMCFTAPSEFDSGLGGGRKKKGGVLRPPHCNLKVVEIVGYRARPCAAEHVKYLIENVVGLEKVVIDPVRRWAYQSSEIGRGVEELKEEEKARDYAKKRLKKIVPLSIRFECL